MHYMEEDIIIKDSDAQNISLKKTEDQFPQEKVTCSDFSETKDQEVFSTVSPLKRLSSDLSDNTVSKKQRTEEYLSEMNNNKNEDIDGIPNFAKASCTQITSNTADSYDIICVDEITKNIKHGYSQTTVLQQNGQNKLFDNAPDEINSIESLEDKPSNEILSDVANGVRAAINSAQNEEKEHDAEALSTDDNLFNKAGKFNEIDKASSSIQQSSSNNSTLKQRLENFPDEIGKKDSVEPSLHVKHTSSRSLNKSTKLENHEILPTAPMVKNEENAEPMLNKEQMILLKTLNEFFHSIEIDHEVSSTESMVRDPEVSVDLLGNVSRDKLPWSLKELTNLDDHEILPIVPVIEYPDISGGSLKAEPSNDSIHFSDSLSWLNEKNPNIERDLVSDRLEQTFFNKPVQFCTQNDLSVEIGTPKISESNEVPNNFQNNSVQGEYDILINSHDLNNTNMSIFENFPDFPKEKNNFPSTDQVEDNHKCSEILLDTNFQSVSLSSEKSTLVKSPGLNSERHVIENQICSNNELISIKCSCPENIQEVPEFNASCNTPFATKKHFIISKEIKDNFDLEILNAEFSNEIETSFDIKQGVDMIEIDSCIKNLTKKNQQCKLDQNKEAININVYEEQMENICNEGKYKNEVNDCTLCLYSTNKHDLDKTTSSASIVGNIISSYLYKDSDKLADEVSTRYQESLFQPLTATSNGEQRTFSTYSEDKSANSEEHKSATVLVGQNFEENFLLNEGNMKCKENYENSTPFLKEIEDIANDTDIVNDTDPDIFPQQCEEISSTGNSSGRSNLNKRPVKRPLLSPFTLGKKIPKYSSKPFASSNSIYEEILAFLENQGQQAFTVQEVVNFVMVESNYELSYFDALHSARIFLRNALNADILKISDGKYVIKSNAVRIS